MGRVVPSWRLPKHAPRARVAAPATHSKRRSSADPQPAYMQTPHSKAGPVAVVPHSLHASRAAQAHAQRSSCALVRARLSPMGAALPSHINESGQKPSLSRISNTTEDQLVTHNSKSAKTRGLGRAAKTRQACSAGYTLLHTPSGAAQRHTPRRPPRPRGRRGRGRPWGRVGAGAPARPRRRGGSSAGAW